jgi:hypothetical protein
MIAYKGCPFLFYIWEISHNTINKEMNIITYVKKVPVIKIILGGLALLIVVYGVFLGNLKTIAIPLALGLYMVTTEGSEINLTNKTYRTITSFFGIHFGKWKPCPEFEYVSVFKTSESQTVTIVTASATSKNDVILLNLFYNGNKHITFYKTTDKADAFKVAEHFKLALGVDILDATEREKKWL